MSPRALPRPGAIGAPLYWRDEVSGVLADAIRIYLNTPDALTVREVSHIRAYLSQWIQAPVWDLNPAHTARSRTALSNLRAGVGAIANATDIRAWLRAALEEGNDPL